MFRFLFKIIIRSCPVFRPLELTALQSPKLETNIRTVVAPFLFLPSAVLAQPLYDSTSDTVFDIITTSDSSAFECLITQGPAIRQMWDKRVDREYDAEGFLFHAYYSGESKLIEIFVNAEFGTETAARRQAEIYAHPIGQLPSFLRKGVEFIGVHDGTPIYSAGAGKIFVYAERTKRRIEQRHLEESLFHEAVHVSLDKDHSNSSAWRDAQQRDGEFLTDYAKNNPEREDLAESALFAYALQVHPGRIPPVDSRDIMEKIPFRLDVLSQIFEMSAEQEKSLDNGAAKTAACDKA